MMTSRSVNACFEAWMHCEHLLTDMAKKNALSRSIVGVIDECALICMGTFHALQNHSANASRLAMLCMGICEECAEVCESVKGESYMQCAAACRECSENMSSLAFANLN